MRHANQQRGEVVGAVAVEEACFVAVAARERDDDVRSAGVKEVGAGQNEGGRVVFGNEGAAADGVAGRRAVGDLDAAVGGMVEGGGVRVEGRTKKLGAGLRRVAAGSRRSPTGSRARSAGSVSRSARWGTGSMPPPRRSAIAQAWLQNGGRRSIALSSSSARTANRTKGRWSIAADRTAA